METGYDYHKKIFDTCEAMMRLVGQVKEQIFFETCNLALPQIPVPVIGVVTGHAAAAGCQLIASCDLVNNSSSLISSPPGDCTPRFGK